MKAIETEYQGYRMRSRLEARWAIFFDAIGVKWQYESEGWDLSDGEFPPGYTGSKYYLPDFYLPLYDYFVEIKPVRLNFNEIVKACMVARSKRLIAIQGTPGIDSYFVTRYAHDGEYGEPNVDYVFTIGRKCDRLWLSSDIWGVESSLNCTSCREPKCGEKMSGTHSGLDDAYRQARSARFEHGETPSRPYRNIVDYDDIKF